MQGNADIGHLVEAGPRIGTGVTFVSGEGVERVEWGHVKEDATRFASALQQIGVARGDRVAVLASTSRATVTLIAAIWACRAAVTMLPLPTRISSLDLFFRQAWERIELLGATVVVADVGFSESLESASTGTVPVVPLTQVVRSSVSLPACDPAAKRPSDIAIIQFTSGSTDNPKMVPLTHSNIALNVQAILEAASLQGGRDIGLSWLPLFHDMGLIGFLITPMVAEIELVMMSPDLFLASPRDWMQWVSDAHATIIGGPNFAYGIAARSMSSSSLDLSSVRLAFNGAEQIDVSTVETFCSAANRHGFDPGAMFCVYGMAESTLAATFPTPGSGMLIETVDAGLLEAPGLVRRVDDGDSRRVRRLARLGRPVPGMELRISGDDGVPQLPANRVGEIWLRGPSLTEGYLGRPDATPEAFVDGWFRTGDLGYLTDGELVVTGRSKDLIVIGGRNIAPEEVERAAAQVPSVRRGNVIAFSVPGRHSEALVVVAEALDRSTSLSAEVSEAIRRTVGVAPRRVVFLEKGMLPKTSSGKLQRARCRDNYLAGEL